MHCKPIAASTRQQALAATNLHHYRTQSWTSFCSAMLGEEPSTASDMACTMDSRVSRPATAPASSTCPAAGHQAFSTSCSITAKSRSAMLFSYSMPMKVAAASICLHVGIIDKGMTRISGNARLTGHVIAS